MASVKFASSSPAATMASPPRAGASGLRKDFSPASGSQATGAKAMGAQTARFFKV